MITVSEKEEKKAEVVVIGGGIAGVASALQLAKSSVKVTILERYTLFSGSSGRNPGRMGHGFHYFDLDTAIKYLEASIAVQKEYPEFLVGGELEFKHPIRHGRYYITRDSHHSYLEVIQKYRKIQEHYAKMVADDPSNMVFGSPESFIRELEVSEYADMVDLDKVEGAVETNEHLFSWPKFSKYLREVIARTPNIRLIEHAEVFDIIPRPSVDSRFKLKVKTLEGLQAFETDYMINASWENIEYLNDKAGIGYLPGFRTNRLKCLLEVTLPAELHDWNSAFFCMGSFCMFSNMGDGRGMITLADETNMAVSSVLKIDANIQRYLSGDIDLEEKDKISRKILDGASQYIPKLKDATIIGLKFGIVQTMGHLDLASLKTSKESNHHVRNYDGIREEQQGLISNPAMKLFYFVSNAKKVEQLFWQQKAREAKLAVGMDNIFYLFSEFLTEDLKKSLMIHMDYLSILSLPSLSDNMLFLIKVIHQKLSVLDEMKQYFTPTTTPVPIVRSPTRFFPCLSSELVDCAISPSVSHT